MQRMNRLRRSTDVTCMALALILLLSVSPIAATETDAQEAKPAAEATPQPAAVPADDTEARPDTSVCLDANAETTLDVNTLEDIFSLSAANVASILDESAEKTGAKTGAKKPAPAEVQWQAVETGSAKTRNQKDAAEKSDDD